ncbi:MAG: histidine--tRNA ligase [Bacilli bacterium]|nr:histidine--tRNA ligase [Bacilli bacterium]
MIQKPKGTYDIYGDKSSQILFLRKLITSLMDKYNYKYVQTPIFESSELFHRGVGETTDIVSKETYDFKDRGNRDLTLRPEGTAGLVRCLIENKLYIDANPLKTWYFGSMFRYERPQSGRNREFSQFGVETFGSNDPMMDAEVISIIVNLFKLLGLKGIKVNINTLGDMESRMAYRSALLDYFKPYLDDLCDDCKTRYSKNPLRILDCKVDAGQEIMKNAPKMSDYLNETSKEHFDKVKEYLESMGIEYVICDTLVRGLDYYTHTVFEVTSEVEGFGSQNVLGAGGRYDNLVKTVGGPDIPGVGFAIGVERLLLALEAEGINISEDNGIDVYAFAMSTDYKKYMFELANTLRVNGFNVDLDYSGRNIKNNFKHADKLGAKFVVIIGKDEVESNILTIKNNETKEEYKVKLEDITLFLDEKLSE